jgi:hypothetical protein
VKCGKHVDNLSSYVFLRILLHEIVSSVGTWIGLGAICWGSISGRGTDISRHHVQTGCEAQSASYPVGSRCPSPCCKGTKLEADYSFKSRAEVTNSWYYTSTNSYVFKSWLLLRIRRTHLTTKIKVMFYNFLVYITLDGPPSKISRAMIKWCGDVRNIQINRLSLALSTAPLER